MNTSTLSYTLSGDILEKPHKSGREPRAEYLLLDLALGAVRTQELCLELGELGELPLPSLSSQNDCTFAHILYLCGRSVLTMF